MHNHAVDLYKLWQYSYMTGFYVHACVRKNTLKALKAFSIGCFTGHTMVNELLVSTNFIIKATQAILVEQGTSISLVLNVTET